MREKQIIFGPFEWTKNGCIIPLALTKRDVLRPILFVLPYKSGFFVSYIINCNAQFSQLSCAQGGSNGWDILLPSSL